MSKVDEGKNCKSAADERRLEDIFKRRREKDDLKGKVLKEKDISH